MLILKVATSKRSRKKSSFKSYSVLLKVCAFCGLVNGELLWPAPSFFLTPGDPQTRCERVYRHYEVFLVVQNAKLTISSGIFSFVFLLFPLLKLFKTGPKVDWGVRDPVYKQKSSSWPKANLKKTGNVSGNLYTGISTFTFFSQEFYIGTLLLLPLRFPTSILTWKRRVWFSTVLIRK